MSSKLEPEKLKKRKTNFSRRGFLQGVGITSGALTTGILETEAEAQTGAKITGPGEVQITLQINGKPYRTSVEPRATLLDMRRLLLSRCGMRTRSRGQSFNSMGISMSCICRSCPRPSTGRC